MMNEWIDLECLLDYSFENKTLLEQALTHRSKSQLNYERLEFVGDGILDYVIALNIYQQYQHLAEGELSKIRSALVNQESLYEIALELNLGKYLRLGDGEEKSGGRNRPSILADSMEAVFAAISFDSDFINSKQVIEKLFRTKIINAEKLILKDSKTLLQELIQARKYALPEYRIIEILGPDHDSVFRVECLIKELNLSVEALGKSKKEASQNAAKAILLQLKKKENCART
jgi:ribonuclease-3